MNMKKTAIMQPYIFPYLGYFQLIHAVDTFVFYDDVNFIKGGWINRNRILLNGRDFFLTVPCRQISPYKLINETEFDNQRPEFKKLNKTLEQAYKKAPYYEPVAEIIESILNTNTNLISELAECSIRTIVEYLDISVEFKKSSVDFPFTKEAVKADRIIAICNALNSQHYINPIGGQELYDKAYFNQHDIQLNFIKSQPQEYTQFNNTFVPGLSIIDVMMFNDKETIKTMLNQYELI